MEQLGCGTCWADSDNTDRIWVLIDAFCLLAETPTQNDLHGHLHTFGVWNYSSGTVSGLIAWDWSLGGAGWVFGLILLICKGAEWLEMSEMAFYWKRNAVMILWRGIRITLDKRFTEWCYVVSFTHHTRKHFKKQLYICMELLYLIYISENGVIDRNFTVNKNYFIRYFYETEDRI